jgi:phosphohistidine phosphatase
LVLWGLFVKTLLLLRHGKSDWSAEREGDHDRPLAPRGKKDARAVGEWLTAHQLAPQLVLTSTALRARDTVERSAAAGKWQGPIETRRELYLCPPRVVLDALADCSDEVERVLVAGHEPTLSGAIELLSGARVDFVTAALARIDFPTNSWRDLPTSAGRLVFLIPPKLLRS